MGRKKKQLSQTVAWVESVIGWVIGTSFSPPMTAARVAADEEERHPLLTSRGGLEEDSFAVATDGTPDFLGAGKGGVAGDVLEHLGELSSAVVHHVPVDTVVICNLLQSQNVSRSKQEPSSNWQCTEQLAILVSQVDSLCCALVFQFNVLKLSSSSD